MHSPSSSPSRISSALSTFESNISKNDGHTSRNFLSNVASSPVRRPFPRRHSLKTAKDIEHVYEQIIDGDLKTNPLISPTNFHRRTVGSASRPGLPSLSLLDDNDTNDTDTEHVVSKEEDDEDASFCELDDDDDDDELSLAESYQEPPTRDYYDAAGVLVTESAEEFSEASAESYREPVAPWDDYAAIRVAVIEDTCCSEASEETNVTEAGSCESDEETDARVSLLPSFEEQTRFLCIRGRKPVCPVSPIKLKDRLRAFQQGELTLTAL
jgi:hypothetical protein